jgi:hypothetical protein
MKTKIAFLSIILFVMSVTMVLPNVAVARTDPLGNAISAGAAKVVITPSQSVPLGGSEFAKYSTGVHDDLYARCVVISSKGIVVALVSLDLLGLHLDDVKLIRSDVENIYGIDADYVIVGSTHTHSAPDVIGIYGGALDPYVMNEYVPYLREKVVEVIGLALDGMRRAVVQVGSVEVGGMTFNRRTYPEAGTTDEELTALRFVDLEGETIATMVNFAVHPVITMTGTLVSADFVGYLCGKLEEEYGGVGIYFNGAQGNINPYMYIGYDSPFAPDDPAQYNAAEEYGYALAEYAIQALENGKTFKNLPMDVAKASVDIPLENEMFLYLIQIGWIRREAVPVDSGFIVRTEVFVVKMGPIEMATIPGEAFVEIGLLLKGVMAKYGFVIGLAPEELGYIVPLDQFDPTRYEESMSVTSKTGQMGSLLTEALLQLIAQLEEA